MRAAPWSVGVFLMAGCASPQSPGAYEREALAETESSVAEKDGITFAYAPYELDTSVKVTDLAIDSDTYQLSIISYCKNDGSVVNQYESTISVEHDYAFRILLGDDGGSIVSILLDKRSFRDSLDAEFYKRARLYLVDFASVKFDTLFFEAFVGVPETDYVQRFEVEWVFRSPEAETMRFWSIPEVDSF